VPVLTAAALRKQIAAGDTAPLYALVGADEVEKAEVAAQFFDVVDEGLRAFNVDRLYGGDTSANELIDIANTLPMMVPRRVIVVLEAEKLLTPKREGKGADEDQARLEGLIGDPPAHATVVFVCGALDNRRRIVKLLVKEAQVVDCGTIADTADAERWVAARAARERVTFAPGAVRVLIERAGLDITRLRGGFDRVVLYAMGQPSITADDVREVVPAGPLEQEDFGIANAIRDGDAVGALRQLAAALDGGAVPFVLLGQLRWVAENIRPPARIKDAVEAVFRTDLALKSSGGDPRILLERLVVELAGPTRSSSGFRQRRAGL
jgi:DNA polymerase-3 subunit delta